MPYAKNTIEELLQLMELEPLEVNLFRGESRDIGTSRVFGGQVLAQSRCQYPGFHHGIG